ncbi:PAS/PAC sensor hybrid histidine kinase (fragment) [Desulfamplus magnetovallimortis]|uniref:histidine kinase n=1 Tax=Desulfamplus magnetovallimortis TaxID=1246637 RepID=A0A1W1H8Q9_9BACT
MKYKLQDLIDIKFFQELQDSLNEICSFSSSILDNDGNILTATAWQEICTRFHRKNKDTERLCIRSNQSIKDHLCEEKQTVTYSCPLGLFVNAIPIIIDGVHYGNFLTGQFFLQEPDLEFFRVQAGKYDFDEEAYLKAVKKVPVWTQKQLNASLHFFKNLISVISENGLKELKDIENRKRLELNEKRHISILKSAMDGYWLTDIKGMLLEVNETYCGMSGYSADELMTMHISDLDINKTKEQIAERVQKIILKGSDRFESRHRRKDGTLFDVEVSIQFRQEDGGQLVCFLRDITEAQKADLALKESEERFRSLHNASFGGIAIHDKGIILECNRGLSEITGFEYDELIGMNGLNLISDDTRDKVIRNIESGYEKAYEAEGVRKNGEVYPLRLEARNIPYRGKKVRVVEFRDITEIKVAEKEWMELDEKFRQAQKMEAVGRLAGGVAHDFNNKLSVITGYAEMAMEDIDPAQPLYESLNEIKKAGEQSADLTRQLLAFARKQTISPKVIDINTTVAGMINMLKRLIGEDIDLVWIPGEDVWPVKMDPSQIDQILANLCVNARDAISDVGKITIETANTRFDDDYCINHPGFLTGEYVALAVSDNGCGMDAETLGNIFEPFFTTKGAGKGTGLGLATVYGAVKQNNGFVNVYSEPGNGTTFKIYLSRHKASRESLHEKVKELLPEHGQETVLVVDDDPTILKMTTMMLKKLGYKVLAANSIGEALGYAREYGGMIHLLLTDVVMPEMNGRDLAENILAIHPDLKCLFMSGYTANVIAHHGILDEGVYFIQKPFSRQELSVRLREALALQ